jgi:hypothetical protein
MYIKFSSICKVHKKSLEKIISQNVRMGEKLKILITRQKNLENRIMGRVPQTIRRIESDSDSDSDSIRIRDLRIESELMKFDSVRIESNPNRIRIDRIRIEFESNRIDSSQIESNRIESNRIESDRIEFENDRQKNFLFWNFVRPCVTQLFNFRENKNFLFWKFV